MSWYITTWTYSCSRELVWHLIVWFQLKCQGRCITWTLSKLPCHNPILMNNSYISLWSNHSWTGGILISNISLIIISTLISLFLMGIHLACGCAIKSSDLNKPEWIVLGCKWPRFNSGPPACSTWELFTIIEPNVLNWTHMIAFKSIFWTWGFGMNLFRTEFALSFFSPRSGGR